MTRHFMILMFLFSFGFAATHAGAQETSGGFLQGAIQIGYDNRACSGALEGSIRYNSATASAEVCDGTSWAAPVNSCTGPADCTNIGDQCTDTTIFAGCHPTTYNKLFIHPNNQSTSSAWSTENVVTSATDPKNGKVNQDWIVANKTITTYPAFKLCDDFNIASTLGYTDWYLPSRVELYYLWTNQTAINAGPGASFVATVYWSSTEVSSTNAEDQSFSSTATQRNNPKSNNYDVRCMRRN